MPDDLVADAVGAVAAEPKDMGDAKAQLDIEREVSLKLADELDKEKESHQAALLRGDQLAGVAADLAPKVSELTSELADAALGLYDKTNEAAQVTDMLVRAILTLRKYATVPSDIETWWNARKATDETRLAALRASGLAKLTTDEKAALGLDGL